MILSEYLLFIHTLQTRKRVF